MRNTLLVSIFVFIAGLGVGYFARTAGVGAPHVSETPAADIHAADLAAIKKLEKADVESTLSQDTNAMTDLWADDGVKIDGPTGPVVGKKAMSEVYAKAKGAYPDFKVLKYDPNIQDVQIADGWAIEVGDFAATYKVTAKDDPVSVNSRGARVLKRQSDGSWKLAVVGLK